MSSEDSDSDSLPDISNYFQKPKTADSISSDDIVFAKYKKLYWPALVRNVIPKEKKVSVWFCDQPGRTFKLPLTSVCPLSDWDRRAKIEKDIKDAGCGYFEAFDGLTTHALRYLRRKSNGCKDDPLKYFDQTYPFFLSESLLKKDPNADVSILTIPPLYISIEDKKNIPRGRIADDSRIEDVSSVSEVVANDSEEETVEAKFMDCEKDDLCDLWKTTSAQSKTETINKIVEFIKHGKADEYLQGILSKKNPSEFYDIFEEAAKYGRRDFSSVSYSGPIKDNNKVSELTLYLLSLLDNVITVRKTGKLHKNMTPKWPFDSKKDAAHYVASVWLPESITYAISKIQGISLTEAMQLFKEIPKSKNEEIRNFIATQEIDPSGSSFKTIESEINENYTQEIKSECVKHSLMDECSPLKKLCKHLGTCDITEGSNIQRVGKGSKLKSSIKPKSKVVRNIYKNTEKGDKSKIVEKRNLKNNKVSLQKNSKQNKEPSESSCSTKTKVNACTISGSDNTIEKYKSDENVKTSDCLSDTKFPQRCSKRKKNPSGNKFKRVDKAPSDENLKVFSLRSKNLPSKRFYKRGKKK